MGNQSHYMHLNTPAATKVRQLHIRSQSTKQELPTLLLFIARYTIDNEKLSVRHLFRKSLSQQAARFADLLQKRFL